MEKAKVEYRTEEVRDIIDRIPNRFARTITLMVCIIVALLLLFGYVIKYPDLVVGEVTISADQPPLQIVAPQTGRLRINNIVSQDRIVSGQVIAWMDNPAHPFQVKKIHRLMDSIILPTTHARKIYDCMPKQLKLGELTAPYAAFLSSIRQLADYQDHGLYDKQENALAEILEEQRLALKIFKEREKLGKKTLAISDKFLERDSILLAKRIISQAEYEQRLVSRIGAEDQMKSSMKSTGSIREQISSTRSSIQQNRITKTEKELELDLEAMTAYNNLLDKISLWEKQFLITSPIGGRAQFLKFWTDNQFVQIGEPLFSVVPEENTSLGKVVLPVQGAGKVKNGQKVIVKMHDYPYMEFGYIEAEVQSISLVSSPVSMADGSVIDTYLITLIFPKGLKTNYGSLLDFRFEAKGSAEIITKDRRLIERFFDNLKHIRFSS